MRCRGAQDVSLCHIRQRDIVGIAAAAGDQTQILMTPNELTNSELHRRDPYLPLRKIWYLCAEFQLLIGGYKSMSDRPIGVIGPTFELIYRPQRTRFCAAARKHLMHFRAFFLKRARCRFP